MTCNDIYGGDKISRNQNEMTATNDGDKSTSKNSREKPNG